MEAVIAICLLSGTFFAVVAGLGILRLPDLYTRMHASTKAGTVGLGFLLLAVTLHFRDLTVASRALGVLLFLFLTAPVAAHLLGRAMLQRGYPFWRKR